MMETAIFAAFCYFMGFALGHVIGYAKGRKHTPHTGEAAK